MPELRQTRFDEVPGGGIAAPNEPHLACVLLLDTSGSMNGAPIRSLNQAINDFKEQTAMDDLAQKRVDIAIIEFNDSARVVQNFTPLSQMQPVSLSAGGMTAMGEGINRAIDMVKERNRFYASMGTPVFQPWKKRTRAVTESLSSGRLVSQDIRKRLLHRCQKDV